LPLASVTAEVRASVGRWLLPLARMNLKMWREAGRISGCGDACSAHGVPEADAIEEAIVGAVRDLILPGFAMLGIATGPTQAWLDAGAPTDDPPAASATAMPGCIRVRVRTGPVQ
jgi:hypothetical protein